RLHARAARSRRDFGKPLPRAGHVRCGRPRAGRCGRVVAEEPHGGRERAGGAELRSLFMRLTDLLVRRPVVAIVINLVILIAGLQALRSVNVRQSPKLESATISVRTVYVGADAELVRGFITTPLERAIAAADGIDFIESQSLQGLSTINARLKLNFPAA